MLAQSGVLDTKFRTNGYKYPVKLTYDKNIIKVSFGFNRALIKLVKTLDTARWDPKQKIWTIKNNYRNDFRLRYLIGQKVYENYDKELVPYTKDSTNRPVKDHQVDMIQHVITRRAAIIGGEMGTGKTLASIECVDWFNREIKELSPGGVWYIGPVSGVRAVRRELVKWDHKIPWEMYTYNKFTTVMANWPPGKPAPRIVIYDESSKIKNPTSKRSQAAMHLALSSRQEWGEESMQILMSGTPAPRDPSDWWHQTEVACPGFLTEPSKMKLKYRCSIVEQRESLTGGIYPHHVTWLDDSKKCAECGEFEQNHGGKDHPFTKSKDQVSLLKKRMNGLVINVFKKDCTDLPEKVYDVLAVKPTVEILQVAKTLRQNAPRTVTALGWLRELSDGFIYKERPSGIQVQCPVCSGIGKTQVPVVVDDDGNRTNILDEDYTDYDEELGMPNPKLQESDDPIALEEVVCPKCEGQGTIEGIERYADNLGTPKDDLLKQLLEEYDEHGRVIIWAGFQGSIDRIVELCHKEGWATLRIDGRGYKGTDKDNGYLDEEQLLDAMDLSHPKYAEMYQKYEKLAVVGHPQAGGMALTFTASPVAIYYSNSFDGEARPQSEDRGHRMGMDINKGYRVIDMICLPSDLLVLNNIKEKKRLQNLTTANLDDQWAFSEIELKRYQD